MAEPGTKVSDVFEKAIKLMDEQAENGQVQWSDTEEYQNRTLAIVNVLLGECYPYSDTRAVAEPGKRPIPRPVTAFEDVVSLDDILARTVLPYGLAAELVKNDDPALGSYFLQRYQELLNIQGRMLPTAWQPVEDIYAVTEHRSFARW